MADPTPVNGQITDAVTHANAKVLAEAPAMALGADETTASKPTHEVAAKRRQPARDRRRAAPKT